MRPVLALELSTDGIVLHELSYDGVWRKIAAAALDDPFLPKRMKDMRAQAKDAHGRFFKNLIWLPPSQVDGLEVKLTSEEPEDRQAEAEGIIAVTPKFAGRNFAVQVGQEDAHGNTQIAVIERQIMVEAQRFATGYGFSAEGFTSSNRIAGFFKQPYFELEGPAKTSIDYRKFGFIAAIIVAVGAVVAGGYWAYKTIDFSTDPSVAIEATNTHIFADEEDPRAPIRPTNSIAVNIQPDPLALLSDQIPSPDPIVDELSVDFGAQVDQLSLTSNTEMAQTPNPVAGIVAVNVQASVSRAIAPRGDDLPAPETSGFAALQTALADVAFPDGGSEFTGGTNMATYSASSPQNSFNITPRLTDVLPSDDSTVVLAAQLRKLNDSLGLTQVRENNAAVVRTARTLELQNLAANVNFGRPETLPILRGGVAIAEVAVIPDVPVTPEVPVTAALTTGEVYRLQRLPAAVITGLPDLTPILRSGVNVADLPDDPVPEVIVEVTPEPAPILTEITPTEEIVDTDAEPTVLFTQILAGLTTEQLQRIPPVVFERMPDVIPMLRGGIEIGDEPIVAPTPLDPVAEIARITTLQSLPPIIQPGRPQVLPTLRGGIEIGATPVIVPEPVDPAAEIARIATLQAIAPTVQNGRPALLPLLRGGAEILGGSGVIIAEPAAPALTDAARLRPLFRPVTIDQIAVLNDPTLSEVTVTSSLAPLHRGAGFVARVDAMAETIAEQARTTPTFTDAPREVSVPTSANVAAEATIVNGINLSATSLIGVFGVPGEYRAMIRERGGKYTTVRVGESVGGWRIVAIAESEVRMQRNGRTETLKMPAAN